MVEESCITESCQFDEKNVPDEPSSFGLTTLKVAQSSWETCSDEDEEETNFTTNQNQEVFLRKRFVFFVFSNYLISLI